MGQNQTILYSIATVISLSSAIAISQQLPQPAPDIRRHEQSANDVSRGLFLRRYAVSGEANVYGSDSEQASALRTPHGNGYLKTSEGGWELMLIRYLVTVVGVF